MALGHRSTQFIELNPRFDHTIIDEWSFRRFTHATQNHKGHRPKSPILPSYKDSELEIWNVHRFLEAHDDQSYLIDGLIPTAGHILLYAPTGHLKSFTAIDIACSVGSGRLYHNRTTTQGEVVYVAAEAATEIGSRIAAWEAWHKAEANVQFIGSPLQLKSDTDMDRLRRFIESKGGQVKLVVIDTVSRCAISVDENKPTEINQYVNAPIEKLIRDTGVSVLLVHHQGGTAGPRGCTAWSDPCDVIIKAETAFTVKSRRERPVVVTLQIEKQRRGEPFALSFKPVRARDTLVLSPISANEADARKPRKKSSENTSEPTVGRGGRKTPTVAQRIVASIRENGPSTLEEICQHTGAKKGSIKNTLSRLVRENTLTVSHHIYTVAAS